MKKGLGSRSPQPGVTENGLAHDDYEHVHDASV